jgi:peptidoglycan hydrolase CwlO-like protein
MSEATEKTAETLKQKLSAHIDATTTKLNALKKELAGMHQEDLKALNEHREQIRQRLDQQKERIRKMQADMDSWKQEKVAHTKEAVGSWRQRHEIHKLEARAERAEEYAVDMVTVAALDFDEAEQAVLDAVAARYEAGQATAP